MLQLNQTYTWNEITTTYPNKWAIITNVKKKNGEIDTCKLLAICNQSDRHIYVKKYLEQDIKFECERTTFNAPNIGVML